MGLPTGPGDPPRLPRHGSSGRVPSCAVPQLDSGCSMFIVSVLVFGVSVSVRCLILLIRLVEAVGTHVGGLRAQSSMTSPPVENSEE